jgi:hypothetical protein
VPSPGPSIRRYNAERLNKVSKVAKARTDCDCQVLKMASESADEMLEGASPE